MDGFDQPAMEIVGWNKRTSTDQFTANLVAVTECVRTNEYLQIERFLNRSTTSNSAA